MHDELAWINEFNGRLRRIKTIVEAARPYIAELVSGIAKGRINRAPSLARLSEWRDTANSLAAREAGFAYEGYVRLKVIDVLESLAKLMAGAQGLAADSEEADWISEVLSAWSHRRGVFPASGPMPKAKPGASGAGRPEWVTMLLSFDYEFRRRRLHFVIQGLNDLYARLNDAELGGIDAPGLDSLKGEFYEALSGFSQADLLEKLDEDTVRLIGQTFLSAVPAAVPQDTLAGLAVSHAEKFADEIDAIVATVTNAFDLAAIGPPRR